MTSSRARIPIPHEQIAQLCRRRHIRWLALFGSVLREDFRADSDIDVLVEFEPEQRYTYFTLSQVEEDLSALLGRKVDLHVSKSLHPFLRDKVLGQAEPLYVGA
ncbi:MAG TPA: nucleotidyltransferase family protein [Methylomirabilota bacterium]|nr:nucleotidyltransferase family protein [Methylomirabilota bacterium]